GPAYKCDPSGEDCLHNLRYEPGCDGDSHRLASRAGWLYRDYWTPSPCPGILLRRESTRSNGSLDTRLMAVFSQSAQMESDRTWNGDNWFGHRILGLAISNHESIMNLDGLTHPAGLVVTPLVVRIIAL